MPLVGFLSVKDPGRISTITNLPGEDRNHRKKILPLRGAELPSIKSDNLYLTIYVRDCPSHKPRGALLPVELRRLHGQEWRTVGEARCCPLCWMIVVKPTEELGFPDPLPQPLIKDQTTKLQKMVLRLGRQKATRKSNRQPSELTLLIKDLIDSQETFSEYDIAQSTQRSRTAIRSAIKRLLAKGEIKVAEQGARGRGRVTRYEAP